MGKLQAPQVRRPPVPAQVDNCYSSLLGRLSLDVPPAAPQRISLTSHVLYRLPSLQSKCTYPCYPGIGVARSRHIPSFKSFDVQELSALPPRGTRGLRLERTYMCALLPARARAVHGASAHQEGWRAHPPPRPRSLGPRIPRTKPAYQVRHTRNPTHPPQPREASPPGRPPRRTNSDDGAPAYLGGRKAHLLSMLDVGASCSTSNDDATTAWTGLF